MRRTSLLAVFPLLLSLACSSGVNSLSDLDARLVTFPDGYQVRAETLSNPADLMRGMKYRDSLAEDRGMLFVYRDPGFYRFWMYEVKVPLDMIWLDGDRKIVQIVHDTPPCPGPPDKCPAYGGGFKAQFIVEVKAGVAKAHNLKPGMKLDF